MKDALASFAPKIHMLACRFNPLYVRNRRYSSIIPTFYRIVVEIILEKGPVVIKLSCALPKTVLGQHTTDMRRIDES